MEMNKQTTDEILRRKNRNYFKWCCQFNGFLLRISRYLLPNATVVSQVSVIKHFYHFLVKRTHQSRKIKWIIKKCFLCGDCLNVFTYTVHIKDDRTLHTNTNDTEFALEIANRFLIGSYNQHSACNPLKNLNWNNYGSRFNSLHWAS